MKSRAFAARRAARQVLLPVVIAVLSSVASAHHVGEALTTDQQLVTTSNQFLAALSQYEKLSPTQKPAALGPLTQLAQTRQRWLVAMMQLDPRVAAARILPQPIRARVPSAAAVYVEQEVHVQGKGLFHVSDDFAHGKSTARFKLQGRDGTAPDNVYMADGAGSQRDLQKMAGRKLSMSALRVGDNLLLVDRRQMQQLQADGSTTTTSSGTVAASTGVVQSNQNTLSILLNFSDKALTCTAADIASRLFGASGATVNRNYQESSQGLVSFSGQAIGPFTIAYPSTGTCDYAGWASAADAAARAAGIDPSQYTRVNYVTPPNSTCGWSGLAYMPGNQSWVQACGTTGVFSHELGHNLSLHHAATPTYEYGDGSDPMGGAQLVDHNGANRAMAGWLPAGALADVTSGGTYALATISGGAAVGTPQVLRVAKPDTTEYYYVSLRQPVNLDAGLAPTYQGTLSIHRASGTLPTKTYLLNSLTPGQSFVDSVNGIQIAYQALSSGTATVDVTFSNYACTRTAPTLVATPTSQSTTAGKSLNYTVSVTNTNPSGCGTSTFNMAQALPSGFAGAFNPLSVALAPGATATTNWTVAAPAGTPDGTYAITATAAEAAVANSGDVHASYVAYSANLPPTVAITSPANGAVLSARSTTISATASDSDGVAQVEFYVDSVLLARDTSAPYSVSWDLRKVIRGMHVITVRATDTLGNSASQNISVTR